jgi:c-di-GMP-binding flagellar brake protein YcgR
MSLLHFRCKERRRTLRVALTVPLTIHGKTDLGDKFSAQTHTQSVNRNGALFHLEEIVLLGQALILKNDHTAQSMECRVVSIHRARDGKQYVGVEFVSPETNFWHMQFPIPGARPLRRVIPSKVSA